MKKSAKVLHLRITVGDKDPRSIEEFKDKVLECVDQANPKTVTVTGMEHLFEGKMYSAPGWEAFLEQGRAELRRMLDQEATEAEAVAEREEKNASS